MSVYLCLKGMNAMSVYVCLSVCLSVYLCMSEEVWGCASSPPKRKSASFRSCVRAGEAKQCVCVREIMHLYDGLQMAELFSSLRLLHEWYIVYLNGCVLVHLSVRLFICSSECLKKGLLFFSFCLSVETRGYVRRCS